MHTHNCADYDEQYNDNISQDDHGDHEDFADHDQDDHGDFDVHDVHDDSPTRAAVSSESIDTLMFATVVWRVAFIVPTMIQFHFKHAADEFRNTSLS